MAGLVTKKNVLTKIQYQKISQMYIHQNRFGLMDRYVFIKSL